MSQPLTAEHSCSMGNRTFPSFRTKAQNSDIFYKPLHEAESLYRKSVFYMVFLAVVETP